MLDTPITDLPTYEAWLDGERLDIDGSFEEAAMWHARDLEEKDQHDVACQVLLRLLERDLLNEEAVQAFLRNALHGTLQVNALELFERFKAALARDLGMAPLAETVALAEQLSQEGEQRSAARKAQEGPDALPTLRNKLHGLTPFVGRDIELTQLLNLLEQPSNRLVTLTGLGGIGKTRLALVAATEHVKGLKHGGVFVPLASVASANLVPNALLGVLGLEANAQQTPEAQVAHYLRDKQALLVLDNFEHLIAAVGFVQTLLESAPGVQLLVTSRERLNLSQEHVFGLVGMALPASLDDATELKAFDAIKLFLKSARRNAPGFTLNAEDRQAIFELCQTLQGVPLALELAASWLRLMSVDELLGEVRQSFDLLESEFSDLPIRHQSLRAVFESSWQLLNSEEQATLSPLALFAGGFTLPAAKAVTGARPRVLLRLVNKSLLRRDQGGRFEFLEVVRQYAFDKLEHDFDLRNETAQKHATYYTQLSHEAALHLKGGTEQLAWLERLSAEHNNLQIALEHHLSGSDAASAFGLVNTLFHYWFIRGHWDEAKRCYERVLALEGKPQLEAQSAKSLANKGYIATIQGHHGAAAEPLEQSVETFRKLGDQEGLAYALLGMGLTATQQADYARAEEHYGQSLDLYRARQDAHGTANALHELGVVTLRKGEFDRSQGYLEEALRLRKRLCDARGAAKTLTNLGIIARRRGDYQKTEALYKESLGLSRRMKDRLSTANTLISYGVLVKVQGRYKEAKAAYEEALDTFQKANDSLGEAIILENMGTLYFLQKQYKQAKSHYEACHANHRARHDAWGIAKALNELGNVSYAQGNTGEALGYLLEALEIASSLGDSQLLLHTLRATAASLSETTYAEQAAQFLAKSSQLTDAASISLAPSEQNQAEETKRRLERTLGPGRFAEHWEKGQRLTLGQVYNLSRTIDPLLQGTTVKKGEATRVSGENR